MWAWGVRPFQRDIKSRRLLLDRGTAQYLQGGEKLREHRFLACLEGSYSDSVKL